MISPFRHEANLFAFVPLEFLAQVDFRFFGLVSQLSSRLRKKRGCDLFMLSRFGDYVAKGRVLVASTAS
jgi:hypothetical protein